MACEDPNTKTHILGLSSEILAPLKAHHWFFDWASSKAKLTIVAASID